MNHSRRDGKRTAREQLREQQQREKSAEKRRRTLKMAAVVVAVLVVVGGVIVVVSRTDGDGAAAEPVVVGEKSAPATLTVYEDFRCPACGQFEKRFGGTIRDLEAKGRLRTEYHLVTIIDRNLGGTGSMNAANAALCAADQDRFATYHDVLFQNQPEERDDAFADDGLLLRLAKKTGGLGGKRFEKCVTGGRNEQRVKASDAAFEESGHQSTPTVLLDGESLYGEDAEPLTPGRLREKVAAAGG